MGLRVIITGATGMVGEGVLHVALADARVDAVLVVGRRPCEVSHPKLQEILHGDFYDLSPLEGRLADYDACFFCLGVSSLGLSEQEYTRLTYELTTTFALACAQQSPSMTFCYVSGEGTDSTENGRMMWARVKGRTENAIAAMSFKSAYMFRPGAIKPMPGMKRTQKAVRWLGFLFPLVDFFAPTKICRLEDIGKAMIHVATMGYSSKILSSPDIAVLGK